MTTRRLGVSATLVDGHLVAGDVAIDRELVESVGLPPASGGGTHNPALMDALRRRLGHVPLLTSDERGLPPDAKESVLWALLGWLSWHGLPGATSATGATVPRILGRFSPGDGPLRLPEPATAPVRRLALRTLDRPIAGRTR